MMRTQKRTFLLAVIALLWIVNFPATPAGLTSAYAAAAPPVGIKPTATITGEVGIVLLNHHGEVDGFLLKDGTRVKFPPHMGALVATVAKPGQRVSVIGFTGLRTQFGTAVEGLSVSSASTGQTVVDQPPTGYEVRPTRGNAGQWLTVSGGVARFLVNPAGSVDGLIMASGEQVKLPPHAGYLVANAVPERGTITISGPGARTNLGTVLRASQINLPSGEIITGIDRPEKKGKGKKG